MCPRTATCACLYKYPQREYPYQQLIEENRNRGAGSEFELLDTGIFDDDRYFDIFIEYAKASPEDICIRVEAFNRGPDAAELHVLPHLWFRNTWSWTDPPSGKPTIQAGRGRETTRDAGGRRFHGQAAAEIFNCNTLSAGATCMRHRAASCCLPTTRPMPHVSMALRDQPFSVCERRISSLRRERRAVRESAAIGNQGLRALPQPSGGGEFDCLTAALDRQGDDRPTPRRGQSRERRERKTRTSSTKPSILPRRRRKRN